MTRIVFFACLYMICRPELAMSQTVAGGGWKVAYANVNSGYDEGNPVVWNRGLAFISNRGRTNAGKYTDRAVNDRFWRMYYVYDTGWVKGEPVPEWKKDSLYRPAVVRNSPNDSRMPAATRPPAEVPRNVKLLSADKMPPFDPKMKDRFNEGPFCFNARQDTLYITRNHAPKGKKAGTLRIQAMILRYGDWIPADAFPFNSPAYSCAHPALHPDGNLLVFVSDMPGGTGGKDLWICQRFDSGWATPVNAGPLINTPGQEAFPTFGADGTLYFSSDRPGGKGGLDIYQVRFIPGSASMDAVLLPDPINSPADDFGLWLSPDGRSGYMTSNRFGSDDILRIFMTY